MRTVAYAYFLVSSCLQTNITLQCINESIRNTCIMLSQYIRKHFVFSGSERKRKEIKIRWHIRKLVVSITTGARKRTTGRIKESGSW